MRAPEDEIDGVDSYTKILGPSAAAYVVLALRVLDIGLLALLGRHLGLDAWFFAVLAIALVVCALGVFRYLRSSTPSTAKRMQTVSVLLLLVLDLALTVAIALRYGASWGEPW